MAISLVLIVHNSHTYVAKRMNNHHFDITYKDRKFHFKVVHLILHIGFVMDGNVKVERIIDLKNPNESHM